MRTLGILGGMGPAATADFYTKLVAATPAAQDAEHLPVLIYGVPQIPDRTAALEGRGASPAPWLATGAQVLVRGGAQGIAIPCNTAHHWFDVVAASSGVPGLHIVDAVLAHLAAHAPHARRIGLLATRATLATGLYPRRAAAAGLTWCAPDAEVQAQCVSAAIAAVKAGELDAARPLLRRAAAALAAAGCEALVAACTEVPLVLTAADCPMPLVDSSAALAAWCVRWARAAPC
jgi:aspartate racemase